GGFAGGPWPETGAKNRRAFTACGKIDPLLLDTATTIKSPSSSSQPIPSSMPGLRASLDGLDQGEFTEGHGKSVARQFQRLGQVDDLMSVDTEDHLLLTRQLDDEFQLLAGRMHQLDSHFALDLGNFSEIATQETKAQQVERSR